MLPAPDGQADTSGGRPRRKGGMDYLKSEDLTGNPQEGRITAVKFDPDHNFGPSVIVKLAFQGKTKFWTLRIKKNPNYEILVKEFGRDENDWVDKRVALWNEEDKFSGQFFPRVGALKNEGKATRAK